MVMQRFPGPQDFSVTFGFLPPGPAPMTWLALLTTRSRDPAWHSGHSSFTSSSELMKSFSKICPHSRHLNSKIGIPFSPQFRALNDSAINAMVDYRSSSVESQTDHQIAGSLRMVLSFHPCFGADAQVILGSRPLGAEEHSLIEKAAAIILPQGCSPELYRTCKKSSALLFPNYDKRFEYPGKTGQSLLFEAYGFPCPKTQRWDSVEAFNAFCLISKSYPHRMPFFLKADRSHEGEGIFLIGDDKAMHSALQALAQLEKSGFPGFISQQSIATEGNVLRAVIIGRKKITYWKRAADANQMITTIGRGSRIDKTWRQDLQEKGRDMVERLSSKAGIDLAAVDLVFPMRDPEPQPLLLEINYYFGRRGLGGSEHYYGVLHEAIQEWLREHGLDPEAVTLW
jgi:ribosomal protein S6--L-glutamate ligase